jgi:16S rRNA (cytidine1402-2'-O)-methyltransferase
LLEELAALYPLRKLVLARELTKKFEEFQSGLPGPLLEEARRKPPKGEFVVLLGPETGS